jgi:manganese/iron transport system permease protein
MFDAVLLFREALYGALVIALACSVLGVYVVLRRIVFVGAALAQLSSAGIALAMFLSGAGIASGLTGHPVAMSLAVTLVLLAVSVPVLLVHLLFYKEFLFVSFDRETARTLGYRVAGWNLLLYLTLGLVIAFAMQFAGVMLVFNFLVLPAVTGLLLARGMAGVFFWSVASAVLAAVIGFVLSVPFDLPTGPAIICISGLLALLAWAIRRLRG